MKHARWIGLAVVAAVVLFVAIQAVLSPASERGRDEALARLKAEVATVLPDADMGPPAPPAPDPGQAQEARDEHSDDFWARWRAVGEQDDTRAGGGFGRISHVDIRAPCPPPP